MSFAGPPNKPHCIHGKEVPEDLLDRVKTLHLSWRDIVNIMQGQPVRRVANLPADLRILAVEQCNASRSFKCLVCSSEFDPVPQGEYAPDLWMIFEPMLTMNRVDRSEPDIVFSR